MDTNELIEKQISDVEKMLCEIGGAFDRPREISNGIIGLAQMIQRLLWIAQSQQVQIEELQKRPDGFGVMFGGGVRSEKADVCACGHRSSVHGLPKGCLVVDCSCRQFRLEAKR